MNSLYKRLVVWVGIAHLVYVCYGYGNSHPNALRMADYLVEHPQQPTVIEHFAQLVRELPQPLTKTQASPIKVAVLYPSIQKSDYWRRSLKAFERRLTDLEIQYQLKIYESRPSIDLDLQAEQLVDALQWQPDFLIFTPDALSHRSTIERLLLHGTPKLILHNITTPIAEWSLKRPFLYTGFDHALGTQLLAKRMLHPNQAQQVGLLYCSPGYISEMRGDTFLSQAQRQPNSQIVGRFYTQGQRSKTHSATRRLLQKAPNLDILFSCSTDIALGAIDVLKAQNKLDQVTLNGWGGGEAELEALKNHSLDLTIMRMNDDASIAMAEAIKLDLMGQAHHVPHVYSGDMVLIDQNTPPAKIDAYKLRAFRYSND